MSERKKRIDQAMFAAKKRYEYHCIICGVNRYSTNIIIGSHIYPRGSFAEFADRIDNIIPLCFNCDKSFEKMPDGLLRSPEKRIEYILQTVHPVYTQQIYLQIGRLRKLVEEKKNAITRNT
jgi:hypothetical protein